MPVVYLPHGGGPLPLMGEQNHAELIDFLRSLPTVLPTPKAIVVVSAHWEERTVTVSSATNPKMIYDYAGFPSETYEYQYPAPGNPALATQIRKLMISNGVECVLNSYRGFDHGTFVPLMLMYPNADVPVVQVSLKQTFDPAEHIAIGNALSPLRKQGILIIGSGMSFHSFDASAEDNLRFDEWLNQVLAAGSTHDITHQLINWANAPSARACHKREEHLLPLHVCWGTANEQNEIAEQVFSGHIFNRQVSGFIWR